MNFKLGELFCGPGGIGLGAKNACVLAEDGTRFTISHAWANDYDKDTCETYRHNICPDEPNTVICRDVQKLEPEALSEIDGLAFGFPCNDFSIVGEQKGMDGVYGPLYSYGIKMLRHFQPAFFLAENVGGLNSANDGKSLNLILDEMHNAGYNVIPNLYKFEQYGVPQSRHRIIIVGTRGDLKEQFSVPAPFVGPRKTCLQALTVPPIPPDAPHQERTQQSAQVVERLKHIKPGENAFTASMPDELRLNVKSVTMSQIYRRLDPNKPAYTITGSGGGGTHVYHWEENRALTNRERARLQTFPDGYFFYGSKESIRKQIGMAVPPAGIQVIFEAILKTFAGINYCSVAPNIIPRHIINPIEISPPSRKQTQLTLWERRKEYNFGTNQESR